VGTIDRDYCGDNDEILLSVYNFTDEEVVVEKGERIAQGMFIRIDSGNFVEVEKMGESDRGGFGSTGSF
jgi:dUTP pyrophosphatase